MLVLMRSQAENLTAKQAVDAVLTEDLHGLELDQRCAEPAAFALALEAGVIQRVVTIAVCLNYT